MKTVWKYILHPNTKSLEIPQGAKVLHVDEQHENICLWVEVYTDNPTEERFFDVFGTGHEQYEDIGLERKFLGSVKLHNGSLIFHVYERAGV